MQPTRPSSQPTDATDATDATEASRQQAQREHIQLRPKQQRRDRNQVTPFGEVLTDFMGSQRPLWTTGKVGQKLGIRRQTVANWIYHDITPPIEVMLEVLAKLNIPISRLIEAYARRGIPVPILAPPEELEELAALSAKGRTGSPQAQAQQAASQEPAPRPPSPEEVAKAWDDMVAQTRAVMLATGFPEQALDALLASLSRRESPADFSRHISSEHAAPQRPQESDSGSRPDSRAPGGSTSPNPNPQPPQFPLRIQDTK